MMMFTESFSYSIVNYSALYSLREKVSEKRRKLNKTLDHRCPPEAAAVTQASRDSLAFPDGPERSHHSCQDEEWHVGGVQGKEWAGDEAHGERPLRPAERYANTPKPNFCWQS